MGVKKYVRFAAPYRSKTFNDKDAFVLGRNGVITGGEVTESASIVTIQPITVVQNGQIVDISVALSASKPTMSAPYFVAISISTTIENVGETITPVFVKRSSDVNTQMVLIAEYDGAEWRPLPKLQINEQIKAVAKENITNEMTGVSTGCDVTFDGSNLIVEPGVIVCVDGYSVTKTVSQSIPTVAAHTSYDRIDALVFRKPNSLDYSIGTYKLITGQTFDANSSTLTSVVSNGASGCSKIRTKSIQSSNSAFVCRIDSISQNLIMTELDETQNPGSNIVVASSIDDYQYCENFDGTIDFVYTRGLILFHKRINSAGSVIYPESTLYTSATAIASPNIIAIGRENAYSLHVVITKVMSGTAKEIGYIRLGSDGSIITPYVQFINLVADLRRVSLAKDDDESLLFVGFDNQDTQKGYLRTYDASTATASLPPTQVGSAIELQTEVYNTTTATLMPTTGASDVRVIRTDNKETFVFWFHFKSVGQYGVAVYNENFKSKFGYKALMLDDTPITAFSVKMDAMNRAYIMGVQNGATEVAKLVFNLETTEQIGTSDIISTASSINAVSTHFCYRGDLITTVAHGAGYDIVQSTAGVKTTLRDQSICSTDVYIAYKRTSDDALAVSDTLIGEDAVVRRLYDMNTAFGAAGKVSWNAVGTNKLVLSQITLRFLSRQSSYLIPATVSTGITLANNKVVYVMVPDEDVDSVLTLKTCTFGDGVLDRHGKKALPLFWNIGGRLFSNFSPYSFDPGGETVTIGGTISDELMAFIGISDPAPDSANHGYGSTTYILESDSMISAIGKLDANLNAVVLGGTAAIIPMSSGTTSVSISFGSPRSSASYRLTGTVENTVDAYPMMQPVVITAKTVNGFTFSWTAPLDSNNYSLDYILRDTV